VALQADLYFCFGISLEPALLFASGDAASRCSFDGLPLFADAAVFFGSCAAAPLPGRRRTPQSSHSTDAP